ncbi:MAG: CDP-alcohol phosphatidyltransferase family protein [Xanthobacteraceae bacterium]
MGAPLLSRWNEGVSQPWERPALTFLATRMPHWVSPDHLTAVGIAGAIITAVAYAFSGSHPALLWMATAGFVVNWFGDSLDGTVARLRQIERPRYGYYLDNALDCFIALPVAVGLGVSGYIRLDVCLLALSIYTMISALTFLRANVTGVFQISYSGVGPTEMRVATALLNGLIFFHPPSAFSVRGVSLQYPDVIALTWCITAMVSFVVCMTLQARALAIEEPPARTDAIEQSAARPVAKRSRLERAPALASAPLSPTRRVGA